MSPCITSKEGPQGFTLIEIILVIGVFAFISSLLMSSLLSVHQFKAGIQSRQLLNTEATVLLNNTIPSLIRPGVAIHYDETRQAIREPGAKGLQDEVDQLSIFTDSAEEKYITLYRKPYQSEGEWGDTAPLHVKFGDGSEVPLHSSEVIVEDFKISIPTDPREAGDKGIQPYINLYIRLRSRSNSRQKDPIITSYQTTIALRNTSPARYKNPIVNLSI